MEELSAYAKEKNVRIILWVIWNTLDDQLEKALDQYAKWGVAGIKVDFMQRSDQKLINYYHKVSRETAKRRCWWIFTAIKSQRPWCGRGRT